MERDKENEKCIGDLLRHTRNWNCQWKEFNETGKFKPCFPDEEWKPMDLNKLVRFLSGKFNVKLKSEE